MVTPAARRFGDRGVEQIGADRDLRRDAETGDQQRRHQRAAADPGQADEHADGKASRSERQQMSRPANINHCRKAPPLRNTSSRPEPGVFIIAAL